MTFLAKIAFLDKQKYFLAKMAFLDKKWHF